MLSDTHWPRLQQRLAHDRRDAQALVKNKRGKSRVHAGQECNRGELNTQTTARILRIAGTEFHGEDNPPDET